MGGATRAILMSIYNIMVLYNLSKSDAIWIEVGSTGSTKCVSEDIKQNIVVIADFSLVSLEDDVTSQLLPIISIKVTSPYGNNLHHQENVTHGQFAFTTTEAGTYFACFWVDESHKATTAVTVSLDWRTGIAAKDWESVARKEKIEGVELELRKLEDAIDTIHQNLIYLKTREAEMREVSETTNGRVAWYSIMSIGVCITVSVTQVFHLKRYFRKKKLI
ncbi:transmembrane emp24 domain-containing protein p24delta3-like [Heracleum sosnowskyi]|uniref:Transmembrane emp24 domain-containing protein p24delta3-like n=1 Tax=Heracleum sosnowskyi TaxID=360622 RepID=A0AAD8IH46_9APIA|nr:transmembrane emp24 domain-containing protein p24delta3-like [Heracleum sosnowskyi]